MAGTPLFKRGRHPSRDCIGGACIKADAAGKLRAEVASLLEKRITDADFQRLLGAVLLAKADSGNVRGEGDGVMNHVATYFDPVTGCDVELVVQEDVVAPVGYDAVRRKDIEVQLRAMTKLADEELVGALRDCDHWTFTAINQETIAVLSDQLREQGQVVDADGETWQVPTEIQLGLSDDDTYLPTGITGLRQAIEQALASFVKAKDRAGPKNKPYQQNLAAACVSIWRQYGRADRQKAWRTTGTGRRAPIVDFADVIFKAAGMLLSDTRIVTLLLGAQKKAN